MQNDEWAPVREPGKSFRIPHSAFRIWMKIAVLGAGAWGTAISVGLAARHDITLWARDAAQCAMMRDSRTNPRYLPGFTLPAAVRLESEIATAVRDSDAVLLATTTGGLRRTLQSLRGASCAAPVVWLCKGFERDSAKLPHEVCAEELDPAVPRGVLSGPSFAVEVARGLPTALTLATSDSDLAQRVVRELHGPRFRVYSSDDVAGVEVAGAVKNVMAIATGICDGLALGFNARAALMTRGLAEMTRLGVRMGGRIETFMGLAGIGDLILTCTGDLSRNRRVGLALARGARLDAILSELGHVAEGVYTAREVTRIARELAVDMPITRAVHEVLFDGVPPATAVNALLEREPRPEFH
jgi:glycerol-3-phosphate dehydrogenase (NAD(P)+)